MQAVCARFSQVFRWNQGSFVLHQKLPVQGVLAVALFSRGGSEFLAISQADPRLAALIFRWSGGAFVNSQEVPVTGAARLEALSAGNDVYLIVAKDLSLGENISRFQCIFN